MKRTPLLLCALFCGLLIPVSVDAQVWSGILSPVASTGSCTGCAVDWSTAGIPGGIPSGAWTQSGTTITAAQSPCSNGAGDCTSTIQTALNACGTNHYVLLGAGTFLLDGGLTIPSDCVLRGSGANQTILNAMSTSAGDVVLGTLNGSPTFSNAVSITGGTSAGSTSITVSSATGISVGTYVMITQVNDGTLVSTNGSEGVCNYCDSSQTTDGSRAQGQISEVTSVSGTTIGINPGLFVSYTRSPTAVPFSAVSKYAGAENFQVYANNTHTSNNSSFYMGMCAYCWISGVETNFTDGDMVDIGWDYHDEIANSYFDDAYIRTSGQYDSTVAVRNKATGILVQNNIFDRTGGIEISWGGGQNVFSYNYMLGAVSSGSPDFLVDSIIAHGAHPDFDLIEGDIVTQLKYDSVHGTSSNLTTFRSWEVGTTLGCNPLSGRGSVTCSPLGAGNFGGANGWWEDYANRAYEPDAFSKYDNAVGDVVGSGDMTNLLINGQTGNPMPQVALVDAPNSRSYSYAAFGFSFGFGETGDTGGVAIANGVGCSPTTLPYPCESTAPYSTAFIHGVFNNANGSTTWATGVTHTLPPSFYLNAKPSWWTASIPYPPIGPDVTGGTYVSGHANLNPAANCYINVMGGGLNNPTGSPLNFNANTCYVAGPAPAASLNLTAVAH